MATIGDLLRQLCDALVDVAHLPQELAEHGALIVKIDLPMQPDLDGAPGKFWSLGDVLEVVLEHRYQLLAWDPAGSS